ncbi:MAG: general secretion pathway protein GspB [Gammaproteobacteria bacterium]|nr:general secretion pathway protein GspB [Gammaproteobacteria bacterium]NND60645.1 GspB domain-containing protein [Gammaproteobacteria bacterium]
MFRALIMVTVCCLPLAAEELSDPMRPWDAAPQATVGATTKQQFRLTAILYSQDRRVAIVNGRTVGEGDRVHGAYVRKINRRSLVIEADGSAFRLALPQAATGIRHRSER